SRLTLRSWHWFGSGQPLRLLFARGRVASRQRSVFSHFSTASPWAYRIGSESVISRKDLLPSWADSSPFAAFPVDRSVTWVSDVTVFMLDCSRNCLINFSDNDRPVPS